MSTIKVNDIQEATSGGGKIWPSRAWAHFRQDGTQAIQDSGNVSSVTDNGTGDTTCTMSNAFVNAFYATTCQNSELGTATQRANIVSSGANPDIPYTYTTTAGRVGTNVDKRVYCVIMVGDQ